MAGRWLPLAVLAAGLVVAGGCATGAALAAHRAAVVESWPHTRGTVEAHAYGDRGAPGVVWYDGAGRRRVLPLTRLDAADVPVGSLPQIAYPADGSEVVLRRVPRQQERAWLQLGLVGAGAAAASAAWWRVDRRRRGQLSEAPRPRRRR